MLAASDAHLVSSTTSRGGAVTAIVAPGQGELVVVTSGLPALPASKVYELWLLGPSVAKPSGLLSAPRNGRTDPVVAAGLAAGYKLGITVEPAGGTLEAHHRPDRRHAPVGLMNTLMDTGRTRCRLCPA